MLLRQIFDPWLAQYAYLLGCQKTGEALVIDPLRDIRTYQELAEANQLRITAVAETHIHADFVSGSQEFARDPDIHLYLSGEGGPDWLYGWTGDRPNTHFLKHGSEFSVGGITVRAHHTPGHTPEHLSYLITDSGGGANQALALATGDFLFVGDVGRPDLLESAAGQAGQMEPSAHRLCQSLRERLQPLAEFLQILPGHGAGSACGKNLGAIPTTTLGYERRFNQPLRLAGENEEEFVSKILQGQPDPPLYFATMKRVNRDGIQVTGGPPPCPELDWTNFDGLAKGEDVWVVDTRMETSDFAAGHYPGALLAPLRSPFFSAATGSYIDTAEKILLVADSSSDAELAALQLYRIGLDNVLGWISQDSVAKHAGELEKLEKIDFADFDPERAAREGIILDVRTSSEFQEGHLPGALSIPYTRLRARLKEVPREERVLYLHCGSGRRAALAGAYLASQGFQVVHVDGICEQCERIAARQGHTH